MARSSTTEQLCIIVCTNIIDGEVRVIGAMHNTHNAIVWLGVGCTLSPKIIARKSSKFHATQVSVSLLRKVHVRAKEARRYLKCVQVVCVCMWHARVGATFGCSIVVVLGRECHDAWLSVQMRMLWQNRTELLWTAGICPPQPRKNGSPISPNPAHCD